MIKQAAERRVENIIELIRSEETKKLIEKNYVHLSFDHVTLPTTLSAKNREALGVMISIRHENKMKTFLLSLEESDCKAAETVRDKILEVLTFYDLQTQRLPISTDCALRLAASFLSPINVICASHSVSCAMKSLVIQ